MHKERYIAHSVRVPAEAGFLDLFHRISEAPKAIPRLRQFILDLAVRGKLVEQDSKDEPAIELLKSIQTEKKRLAKAGLIKNRDSQRFLTNEDVRFAIPKTWTWTRLGEVGDWGSGSTPPRGSHEYFGGDISWLKSGELNDKEALAGSEEKVTSLALSKCSFRRNVPGDILFAMYGATIGKAAILAEPAVTNQAVVGCTPFSGVLNRYLFKFLLAQRAYFHQASEGGAQPNVSKEKMIRCPFPLPPLAEQHRIVTKVDELMALCDRLEVSQAEREQRRDRLAAASLHHLNNGSNADAFREHARFTLGHLPRLTARHEHIQQLRQTILNLAVRGKLVPQNPRDEPAHSWLHSVVKATPSVNADSVEPPFSLPKGWLWLRTADVFEVAGGIQKTPHRAPRSNAFPYLGVGNVYRGRIDLTTVKRFELEPGELERRRLQAGDLLIIEGNGSITEIGRCAKWNGEIEDCVHQNHVIRCRPRDVQISPFVLLFLNSPKGMEIMQHLAITSSGLYSLSVGKIRQIQLPMPPLAEQHRIVAKVEALMSLCDRLEVQLATTQTESRRLLEAVLHEALHPTDFKESIEPELLMPAPETDQITTVPEKYRLLTLVAARLANSFLVGRTGGDRKRMVKSLAIAQRHVGIDFGWFDFREAAGPHNGELLRLIEQEAVALDLLEIHKQSWHSKTVYNYKAKRIPESATKQLAEHFGNKIAELDRLAQLFSGWTSLQAELYATAYAVWNDLLIEKVNVTDNLIIEVVKKWSEEKCKKYSRQDIATSLRELREMKLVPQGFGPKTKDLPLGLFDGFDDAL